MTDIRQQQAEDRATVALFGDGKADSDYEDGVPEIEPIYVPNDLQEVIVINGRAIGGVICI